MTSSHLRNLFKIVLYNPDHLVYSRGAAWMSAEQCRQLHAFVSGQAIPTDPELRDGLEHSEDSDIRARRWTYSNVASALVGMNFPVWCELIREHAEDADLAVDKGL